MVPGSQQGVRLLRGLLGLLLAAGGAVVSAADEPTPQQLEFFETRIRPVLIEQCYECHNSAKLAEGELAVDQRSALLKGGSGGAIIVPGKPAESKLIAILRHQVEGVKMPLNRGKLDDRIIADFETWITQGAVDPRDRAPSEAELTQATSWETTLQKRKQWWSFQPVRELPPPDLPGNTWSDHPIDRFVLAKLREKQLEPGPPADAGSLIRRAYLTLIGLPPAPDDLELWTERLQQPSGFSDLIDHLLSSPRFGEHWARHWMDWIRYAESHGSEGDPVIDNAWQYRDYLIRALNADVAYDQLVREHIAGDLLEQPRLNRELGINESLIGPAHWRMVFHGFAPTDALDEKVRFIDDEINTFTKAFLGLTVSCARCHDHKFDPISQKDYYALFGILGSCRPGRVAVDMPDKLEANREQLLALKPRLRTDLSASWLAAARKLKARLLAQDGPGGRAAGARLVLNPWFKIRRAMDEGATFEAAWQAQFEGWQADRRNRDEFAQRIHRQRWKFNRQADADRWFRVGTGLSGQVAAAGDFNVSASGDRLLNGLYPAGVFSHLVSDKHAARWSSEAFTISDNYDLWLQVTGDGGAAARFVVHDYPRNGTVFPVTTLTPEWTWQKFDLSYWNGDEIHVELTTAKDAPVLVKDVARSWFGIREAVLVKKGDPAPPVDSREFLDPLFEHVQPAPRTFDELAGLYVSAVNAAVAAWQAQSLTDGQALFLDACLKQGLLPGTAAEIAGAASILTDYRHLEDAIVVPTRVPGLEETVARVQPLYIRGNHKTPGEAVPRRFLEAIDATPYQTRLSGRRELAESIVHELNPLTRRVIVNRLWQHLFGRGLVATPDNFGRLGQPPTHPELLDYLASDFRRDGGSLKRMMRLMVTSRTWQAASRPTAKAQAADPRNELLSHSSVRRLEAEGIRDSLLAVSGRLEPQLFGPPTDGHSARRSLYVRVHRNSLDPFLRAFDFPEPFSSTGRRDVTNVPAQSLTMLNDEFVASLARTWAAGLLKDKTLQSSEQRLGRMLQAALARPARPGEIEQFQRYLTATRERIVQTNARRSDLQTQIEQRQAALQSILAPVQERLSAAAKNKVAAGERLVPEPISRWEFEGDLQDAIGSAHGTAREGARVENGALIVNAQGHVITAPIKQTLKAKTLEAWVQLEQLDQSGGGVMTIQTPDGVVFDSIVFGEQSPRQWLAGSNGFERTQPFNGPPDQVAAMQTVHLAIAYHADGRIVGYRNGVPYGKPYHSKGPAEFKAGEAVLGFGIRHLPAGGNRMLSGRILRAQLYDRALTNEEVLATSQSAPYLITEAQVLAALTAAQREQVSRDREFIRESESQIEDLGPVLDSRDDLVLWTEVARAIFTLKEFIYVK